MLAVRWKSSASAPRKRTDSSRASAPVVEFLLQVQIKIIDCWVCFADVQTRRGSACLRTD